MTIEKKLTSDVPLINAESATTTQNDSEKASEKTSKNQAIKLPDKLNNLKVVKFFQEKYSQKDFIPIVIYLLIGLLVAISAITNVVGYIQFLLADGYGQVLSHINTEGMTQGMTPGSFSAIYTPPLSYIFTICGLAAFILGLLYFYLKTSLKSRIVMTVLLILFILSLLALPLTYLLVLTQTIVLTYYDVQRIAMVALLAVPGFLIGILVCFCKSTIVDLSRPTTIGLLSAFLGFPILAWFLENIISIGIAALIIVGIIVVLILIFSGGGGGSSNGRAVTIVEDGVEKAGYIFDK